MGTHAVPLIGRFRTPSSDRFSRRIGRTRDVQTYDPFQDEHSARPSGTFNLILCFEVLEHVPDPTGTLQDICSFLDDDSGLILFSTVLTPADIDRVKVGWWYIAPRNGHVSIYSRKSLGTVLRKCGLHLASASQGLHFAFRQVPEFAKHILKAKK